MAIAGLMAMAGACELYGVLRLLAELRGRNKAVADHFRYRGSRPEPTVGSEPILGARGGVWNPAPLRSATVDELTRELARVSERVQAIDQHVRDRLRPQINRAVQGALAKSGAADKDLEKLVLAIGQANRGKTRLAVMVLSLGIVLSAISNVWSLSS